MNNSKKTVDLLLKMLGKDGNENIECFLNLFNENEFFDLDKQNLESYTKSFFDDKNFKVLLDYSGLQARYLNPYLRKGWSYEIHGKMDDNKIREMQNDAEQICNLIINCPSINEKFKCYRGVTLDYFSDYGISSLEDLYSLQGTYFYDAGFTSTSIDRNSSFLGKQILNGQVCNVEITYYVDGNYSDGIFLGVNGVSENPEQLEYLINKGNMSKILEVVIENNVAYIKAVLIPNKVLNGELILNK